MLGEDNQKTLGELQARCMILESQVAALSAFACAILERHPQKDQLLTRWANHMTPAMQSFLGTTADPQRTSAMNVPGWVQYHLDEERPPA